MASARNGFTLIELMIVIAIIGILSTLALPSFQDRIIQSQVAEAIAIAEVAKRAIEESYARRHSIPASNAAAGLPEPRLFVGNYVERLEVSEGAISVTLGNRVNRNVAKSVITLRPAVVRESRIVPIAWICGNASVPTGMTVLGANATSLRNEYLPIDCRP